MQLQHVRAALQTLTNAMELFTFVMTITVKSIKENIVEEYYATTHSVHVGQHACKHTMTLNPNYMYTLN